MNYIMPESFRNSGNGQFRPGKHMPSAKKTYLNLGNHPYAFSVRWFNPRTGGELETGSEATILGPGSVNIGEPPRDPDKDWVVLVKRQK